MEELNVYPAAGIRTDHEATTAKEAKERLDLGMYLMVREGTVAKDLASLLPAITPENSRRCFFVTDDKLINDLVKKDQSIISSVKLLHLESIHYKPFRWQH